MPDPSVRPLVPLVDAARWLDIGRTTAYRLAAENAFPVAVLEHGGKLVVRTADLLRYAGLDV